MKKTRLIPVSQPSLIGNEKQYVIQCLDDNWISSQGRFIEEFEEEFRQFCGVRNAITCSNGTAALHLALLGLGVGPGDEVVVPTLSYVATANAVTYCGARPVFVDSERNTWNIDPGALEGTLTPRTKAIIAVHTYGCPADMGAIMSLAEQRGIYVIEDAAEAHGAEYRGQRAGSLGHVATFSFYGNKIISTGEGGMVTTDDDSLAKRIRQTKGQGMDPKRRYWFPVVGYNYRMTNIQAAIGLAQLENAEWHVRRRIEIAEEYKKQLAGVPDLVFQANPPDRRNVYWMTSVVVDPGARVSRDQLQEGLARAGIETRPFFYPLHSLPIYRDCGLGQAFPIAEGLAANGINLPSFAELSSDDLAFISKTIVAMHDTRIESPLPRKPS